MKNSRVSNAAIRRLPRYYRKLTELKEQNIIRVSSLSLGKSMNLTASQIRQDLACFGEFGQQGYGYNVEHLRAEIGHILGIDRSHSAIIIGLGNLGRALARNFHFARSGIDVKAAFDIDPTLIGKPIDGLPVYAMDKLKSYLNSHKIDIAVLTVPQNVAISTAEVLASCGIPGIWNFTNIELNIDNEETIVENIHFADSLLALSYMITEKEEKRKES